MLIQSVKKEAIIIANDLHSLAVLLLLPITFMIIMTLAMGEQQDNLVKKINLQLSSAEGESSQAALAAYLESSGFRVNQADAVDASLTIEQGFQDNLLMRQGSGAITLSYSDELSPQTRAMVVELVKVAISKLKLHAYMQDVGDFDEELSLAEKVAIVNDSASVDHLLTQQQDQQIFAAPTLYSIPSWLIFGIYFIVLPISTTLIKEKDNGTLVRIQTYPITNQAYFFNKALSYGVVSVFQWLLLSAVGLLFVPWLTEQALLAIHGPLLYLFSALFIIFAAIGFAFLMASIVNTYEQAIVLGGGINILLAALSGFMVPIDIMPEALAQIANYSPMYWSAELLKLSLGGENFAQALPYLLRLLGFGGLCYIAALAIFNHKTNNLSWS